MPPILPTFQFNQLQTTEAVPFVDDEMEKLLLALEHDTVRDVGLELYHRARTNMLTDAECRTAMHKLVCGGPSGLYMELLHSMHKETIRALIYGTVAYQARSHSQQLVGPGPPERPLDLSNVYLNGPGVYSVSVLVDGEDAWLTADELTKVIETLATYIDTHYEWIEWGRPATVTDATRRAQLTEAAKVDKALNAPKMFFFLEGPGRRLRAGKLLLVLHKYRRHAPATGRMVQCPQYIGCSHKVGDRWHAQRPGSSDFNVATANTLICLLMSCMLVNGVIPAVVGHPLLTCWEELQLPVGEVLLTMLAGSMCGDRGFNAQTAGGTYAWNVPLQVWQVSKEQALGISPHFLTNMAESTEAIRKRLRQTKLFGGFDEYARRTLDDEEEESIRHTTRYEQVMNKGREALRKPVPSIELAREDLRLRIGARDILDALHGDRGPSAMAAAARRAAVDAGKAESDVAGSASEAET